jgi:hypothetical protein
MHDLVYHVTALLATGFRNDLVRVYVCVCVCVCVCGGVVEACQSVSMAACACIEINSENLFLINN